MNTIIKICCMAALIGAVETSMAQTQSNQNDTEAISEIDSLRTGLVESFNAGDVEQLLTYLDADVVVTWQNGEVCAGIDEVRAFHNRMMSGDDRIVETLTANPAILGRQIQGDWAVSWGRLNDHFILTDGSDLPMDSRFTATIAKRGDQWKVTAFHVSVNAFDNPITNLAVSKIAIGAGVGGLLIGALAVWMLTIMRHRSKKTLADD